MQTFEDQARETLLPLDAPADPQAREHYAIIFLLEYSQVLSGQKTGAEAFISAYGYKVKAEQHGASARFLDEEAYRMRQEWARRTAPELVEA